MTEKPVGFLADFPKEKLITELLERLANLQAKLRATPKELRVAAADDYKADMAKIKEEFEATEKAAKAAKAARARAKEAGEDEEPRLPFWLVFSRHQVGCCCLRLVRAVGEHHKIDVF